MKQKLLSYSVVVLIALGIALGLLAAGCGSHHHATGDSDHASDCWAHAYSLGHRHCAT